MSEVTIYHLIDGAKQAEGLTVIIDVFRAFSLECYLYDRGVREIRPVGSIDEARALHRKFADSVLIGERKGVKIPDFDFGNSPSTIPGELVKGKLAIHTTSAGTQGIVNAVHADQILTGSLVNAKAVAQYIRKKNPEKVSLVCMGNSGVVEAAEDELCAEYMKSLIEGNPLPDIKARAAHLQVEGGEHFFDPDNQSVFPEGDFWLCIQYDRFPFVIEVSKDADGFVAKRIDVELQA